MLLSDKVKKWTDIFYIQQYYVQIKMKLVNSKMEDIGIEQNKMPIGIAVSYNQKFKQSIIIFKYSSIPTCIK